MTTYANWMLQNTNIHAKKLRYICLPATHDTGTYGLTDILCPTDQKFFALIEQLLAELVVELTKLGLPPEIDPAALLLEEAIGAVKGLATANNSTVAQQLQDGIRAFDLRVALDASDDTFKIYHGLFGPTLDSIYDQIADFLRSTTGEIVYLNLSHFSPELTSDQMDRFCQEVVYKLGTWAFLRRNDGDTILNDPFELTYTEIVGVPAQSRIILVNPSADPNNHYFWPVGYCPPVDTRYSDDYRSTWDDYALQGVYTNTEQTDDMIPKQLSQFEHYLEIDKPLALYMTLTPSGASYTEIIVTSLGDAVITLGTELGNPLIVALGEGFKVAHGVENRFNFTTLLELSQRVDRELEHFVVENFVPLMPEGNRISMIFADYYETTELVELAISLSNDFAPEWTSDQEIPAPSTAVPQPKTDRAPGAAIYNGDLFVAYKHNNADEVWVTVFQDGSWTQNYKVGGTSFTLETDEAPSLASFDGLLYLAYTNKDDEVCFSTFNGSDWSAGANITINNVDFKSDQGPYLTVYDDRLHAGVKGDGNNDLKVAILNAPGGSWYDGVVIGDIGDNEIRSNKRPAICAFNQAFYMLYKDDGSDDINQAINNGTWSGGGPIQDIADVAIHPKSKEGPSLCVYAGDLFMVYRGLTDHIYVSVLGESWGVNERISTLSDDTINPQSNMSPCAVHTGTQLWVFYKQHDGETIRYATYEPVKF